MKIRTKQDREFERQTIVFSANKFKCKHYGHKQLIPNFMKKNLCDWCGHWVFRNEKDEFEYRMKEQMKRKEK